MTIKNDEQLAYTYKWVDRIRETIKVLDGKYSGTILEILKMGWVRELEIREKEIAEYLEGRQIRVRIVQEFSTVETWPLYCDSNDEEGERNGR